MASRMVTAEPPWPLRCAALAHRVSEVEKQAGDGKALVLSAEKLAIRAKGWSHSYVSFYVDKHWSAPVEAKYTRGALTCRDSEATLSTLQGLNAPGRFWPVFIQTRCTVSGCQDVEVDFKRAISDSPDVAPLDAKDVQFASVGGKVLVVWRAGERGGLRMRMAPAEQLSQAKDIVVFDDHMGPDGPVADSNLVGFGLLPLAHSAVLLLSTTHATHALSIRDSGAMEPISVARK